MEQNQIDTVTELAKTINRILAQATSSLEAENSKLRAVLRDIAIGPRQEPDFEAYAVQQAKKVLNALNSDDIDPHYEQAQADQT